MYRSADRRPGRGLGGPTRRPGPRKLRPDECAGNSVKDQMLRARPYTFWNRSGVEPLKPQGKLTSGTVNVGWEIGRFRRSAAKLHKLVLIGFPWAGPALMVHCRLSSTV